MCVYICVSPSLSTKRSEIRTLTHITVKTFLSQQDLKYSNHIAIHHENSPKSYVVFI